MAPDSVHAAVADAYADNRSGGKSTEEPSTHDPGRHVNIGNRQAHADNEIDSIRCADCREPYASDSFYEIYFN